MSKIDYQALREAAEQATKGSYIVGHTSGNQHGNITGVFVCQKWKGEPGGVIAECHVNCLVETDVQAYANAEFIAAFNPNVALALLDERERNLQYIKRRDQENEDIALTVGRLRVELESKGSKIANLTAERDALREGEMGDARHSNTRAAADIYFQLVEECEIPAGGSLVGYIDDIKERLGNSENHSSELDNALCELLPGTQYMDPPDGGSVTPLEQVRRMVADYRGRIEELESRTVNLPEALNSYAGVKIYRPNDVIEAIRAAGIRIKGE